MVWALRTPGGASQAAPPQASPHHSFRALFLDPLSDCLLVCNELTVLVAPFHLTEETHCPCISQSGCLSWFQPHPTCDQAADRTQWELGQLLHFWMFEFGHSYSTSLVFHFLSGKLLKQERMLYWMKEAGNDQTQVCHACVGVCRGQKKRVLDSWK